MSQLKAILFRRDRWALTALVAAVILALTAGYFLVSQQPQAEAWSTTDTGFSNNAVASDTVPMGETDVLVLDITLPDPTTDTLLHNGAAASPAESELVAFSASEKFTDSAVLDGTYDDGEAIVFSANANLDAGVLSGAGTDDVLTAGTANLTAFAATDVFYDDNTLGDDNAYDDGEAILVDANAVPDATTTVQKAGKAGVRQFEAADNVYLDDLNSDGNYDALEPIWVDTGDTGVFDAGADFILVGTIVPLCTGLCTEVSALANESGLAYLDDNNDGLYSATRNVSGEVVVWYGNAVNPTDGDDLALTTAFFDAGQAVTDDDIAGTWIEDLNAFAASDVYCEDGVAFYDATEAIVASANATLETTDTVTTTGTCNLTNFAADEEYVDNSPADASYDDGEDIYTDEDVSGYVNADVMNGITINNNGTALDADIDDINIYQEDGTTAGFQAAEDTLIGSDTTFDTSIVTLGAPYSDGSADQRFYVSVDIDLAGGGDGDPTDGATIIAELDPGVGDGVCNVEGEAACAVLLESTTIGTANAGGDGPEDLAVTSAGTITIDAAVPTITTVYTLDGFDAATVNANCVTNDFLVVSAALVDGSLDAMCVELSEAVDDSTITATDFTVAGETITTVDTGGTANDQWIFVILDDGFYSTGGAPDLTYTAGTLEDSSGNPLATAVESSTDLAPPAILSAETDDNNSDGTIDRLVLTFSESVRVTDGVALDGFPAITLVASSGTATIDNFDYATVGPSTLTLNITADTAGTDITVTPTYDDDASVLGHGICDAATTAPNCNDDYPDSGSGDNQMVDGETVAGIDGAGPIFLSAETTSDNDIAITFSEAITGAAAGDLTTNGGAVTFASVDAAAGTTITWENATTAWNTDATGSDAGTGTDSTGTVRTTIPNLTMGGSAVVDGAGNGNPAIANSTLTTDGAAPIALSAEYLDVTVVDGTVDRVDITMSEDMVVNGYVDGDWTFSDPGDMGLDDTGLAANGEVLEMDVSATFDITGSIAAVTVDLLDSGAAVTDDAAAPNNLGVFSLGVDDAAAPFALGSFYEDSDVDGDVDRLGISISLDTGVACAFEAGDWTIDDEGSNSLSEGIGASCATDGTENVYFNGLDSDAEETGGPLRPDFTYSNADLDDSVADAAGNALATSVMVDATDAASPIILSGAYQDSDSDGDINRYQLTTTLDFGLDCSSFDGSVDITVENGGDFNLTGDAADGCVDNGTSIFTINLAVEGDPDETGSDVAVVIDYTNPGNGLEDGEGNDVLNVDDLTLDDEALPLLLQIGDPLTYSDDGEGGPTAIFLDMNFTEDVTLTYDDGDFVTVANGMDTFDVTAVNSGNGTETVTLDLTSSWTGATTTDVEPTLAWTGVTGSIEDDAANAFAAFGATSLVDLAVPAIQTMTYIDGEGDGSVDTLTLDFSEDIIWSGENATDWDIVANDLTGFSGSASLTGIAGITMTLNSASDTVDLTGVSGGTEPTLAYTLTASAVTDDSSETNAMEDFIATSIADGASPILLARDTRDDDEDGEIDSVDVSFSESVDDSSSGAGAGGWEVAGYAGDTFTTGATADDENIRVTFTQSGTADTDATPTISYTAGTLADADANLVASSGATATTDEALPVIVDSDPFDGEQNVSTSISPEVTWSEPMDEASVEASFSVAPDWGTEVFAWDGASEVLTINPDGSLDHNIDFVMTFEAGYASAVGTETAGTAEVEVAFETRSASTGGGGGGGGGSTAGTEATITLTEPDGGETYIGGDIAVLSWTTSGNGINSVRLYASLNGGATWSTIATGLEDNDSYNWTVPNTATTNARIKAAAFDSGSAQLDSDTSLNFTIVIDEDLPVEEPPAEEEGPTLFTRSEANAMLPGDIEVDDLIKGSLPAVYYVGLDAKRHPFPNEQIYFTWYEDFSGVRVVTDAELAAIGIGTPILTRPGTLMVKIQSDNKTYAVEPGYVLRWVTSESVAADLYGPNWNQRIMDVEPTYFSHFTFGADITTDMHPSGTLLKTSTNTSVYYLDSSMRRHVLNESAFAANHFQWRFVTIDDDGGWASLPLGDEITGMEDELFSEQLP